jgi:hypothetical protein
MFAAYVTVTVLAALVNGSAAATYLIGHDYPKTQADMKRVPRTWVPVLGTLLAAGAVGLLAGFAVDFVLRYHRGPSSELIKLPHPDDVDDTEGRFVARGMAFAPSFVLAGEDELGAGRPDDRDEAILESVGGGVRGGARMLGRPTFFRPELPGAFDPEQNTLLLALSGMRLWRGADDRKHLRRRDLLRHRQPRGPA